MDSNNTYGRQQFPVPAKAGSSLAVENYGFEINASVDEQEEYILQVASGKMNRSEFMSWLRSVIIERQQ